MPGLYENLLGAGILAEGVTPEDLDNILFNIAGGQQEADRAFQSAIFNAQQRQFQLTQGGSFLDQLINLRRDPSSPGGILQAMGQVGGGSQLGALSATGGQGFPTSLSPIIQQLIETQAIGAGAAPTNPNTGLPFTENEVAYMRIILGQQGQVPTGIDPATGFTAFGPAPQAQAGPQAQAQPASSGRGGGGSGTFDPQKAAGSRPQTEALAQTVNRIRQASTKKRAGRFLNSSQLAP